MLNESLLNHLGLAEHFLTLSPLKISESDIIEDMAPSTEMVFRGLHSPQCNRCKPPLCPSLCPLLLLSVIRWRVPGGAAVPDHVQPPEQADSAQQPPLPLYPGGQRHHGEVRRRGEAKAAAGEAHLPAEDQHA